MRVLILSQHFVPEVTAARFRIEPFVDALRGSGHEVEVVCAVPNHPEGVIDPRFRGRPLVRQRAPGLAVDYVWVRVAPEKTMRTRLELYGSYAAMAVAVGVAARRPDVVLASSPPLTVGLAGALVAARHRVPWVLDVRDLWPKAAIVLGELSSPRSIAAAERLERWLYRRASLITTVTEPFRRHIAERAPSEARIEVLPNGTTRAWIERGRGRPDRAAIGMPADRFVWAYAGNLGLYHGLDTAMDAAELLGEGYQLHLIGHGPLRDELERRAAELPPGRVRLEGLMSPDAAAERLLAADALLVALRASLDDVVSSKLFDYCALGRPVIVAATGETRRLAEGAALLAAPEDPVAMADAVRTLRDDPELGRRLGERARELAAGYLREAQAQRLVSELEALTSTADSR
ncbi:MAG: glycosyltransferase WbuB [Acidobacteria bacterium]|nr:MAG: glycosyltransferase WbuB [Acidobacteriota bacterium]GIK78211.1 MAG: glycosyltransferase WbuB [Actinomycetes bacterium]